MEKEVAALRQVTGASSGRDLEAMLGALSTASPAQRPVSALEFAGGELRVKGLALRPDEAQAMAGTLKRQGYSSVLQGETLSVTPENLP
jgi:general secretion pathway protein L